MAASLKQSTSGHISTDATLTLTFGSAVTAGSLVVITGFGNFNPSGPVGGTDTFAGWTSSLGSAYVGLDYCGYCLASAGGYTSITIPPDATSYYGGALYAMEFAAQAIALDVVDGLSTTASAWTSAGTSPATTSPSEIWIGCGSSWYTSSATCTATAGGGWTNLTAINGVSWFDSFTYSMGVVAGYQIASATGTPVYSGTSTGTTRNGSSGVIATFKLSTGSQKFVPNRQQAVKRAAFY